MSDLSGGPLVSVMIPVYNGARYLGEAIESVLTQTYPRIEVIVVDDGSDDGSGDVARAFAPAVQCVVQPRAGNGAARNRAVERAAGSYWAFLDADDRFVPDKLERQLEAFERDPALDMVFGHVTEFISPELDPETAARLRKPAVDVPWMAPNLMLVKRESFERVGPFATDLRVGVTVDWYARAHEQRLRSFVVPAVVLERRLHAQNNGLRERDSRSQYLRVLKASLDRRRRAPDPADAPTEPEPDVRGIEG